VTTSCFFVYSIDKWVVSVSVAAGGVLLSMGDRACSVASEPSVSGFALLTGALR
jgi:hypothetical protein